MRGPDNILASLALSSTQKKQRDIPRRGRTFYGSSLRYVANKNGSSRSYPHILDICTSPIITALNDVGYRVVSLSNSHRHAHNSTTAYANPREIQNTSEINGSHQNRNRNTNSPGGAIFKQAYTMVGSYSSAKLAPPLVGASVVDYEQRKIPRDHRVWYTVQIYPCPIAFPHRAGSEPMAPIPRKSYKVFRKFEDMLDFAIRLEDEFPWLKSGHDTALKTGLFMSMSLRDRTVPAWPLLKVRRSQVLTDSECEQRKRDMNQYLQQLFSLGPTISHSTLVAEFFGIWKTDLDVHLLRQEDRDPLALHCLVSHQFELTDMASSVSTTTCTLTESLQVPPALWSRTSSMGTCPTDATSPAVSSVDSERNSPANFPWGETFKGSTAPASITPRLAPALVNWSSVLRASLSPPTLPLFTMKMVSAPLPLSYSSQEVYSFQSSPSPLGSTYHSTDEEFNALFEASDFDEDNTLDEELSSRLERCPGFYDDVLAMPPARKSVVKSTSLQDLRRASRNGQDLNDSQIKGKGWCLSSRKATVSTVKGLGQVSKIPALPKNVTTVQAVQDPTSTVTRCNPGLAIDSNKQPVSLYPAPRCHICDTIESRSSPTAISHSGHKSNSPLSTSPVITPQMHPPSSTSSRWERTHSSRERHLSTRHALHTSREAVATAATGTVELSCPIKKDTPAINRLINTLARAPSSELSRSRAQLDAIAPRSNSSVPLSGCSLSRSLPPTSNGPRSETKIDRRVEVSTMLSVPTYVSWVDHRPVPHLKMPPAKNGRSAGGNNSAPIALLPPTAVSLTKEPQQSALVERQHQQSLKGPNNKRGKTENRPTSALAAAAASSGLSFVSTSAPMPSFPTSSYFSFTCTNNNNNDNDNDNDKDCCKTNNRSNNESKLSFSRPSSPSVAVTSVRASPSSSPIKTPVSILKNGSYFHGGTDHKISNGVTTKSFGKRSGSGIHDCDNNNNNTVSQHNNGGTNGNPDSLDQPRDDHNQDRVVTSFFPSRGGLEDQGRAAPAVPGLRRSSSRRDINIASEKSPTAADLVTSSSTSSSLRALRSPSPRCSPTPHLHPPQLQRSGASGLASPSSASSFTQRQKNRDQDHKCQSDPASAASASLSFISSSASHTRQPRRKRPPQTPERATSPIPGFGLLSQQRRASVATFKIVVDAERIVALQVLETDQDFQLSVPDLRRRVQSKFERMDMPLPREFELVWTAWHGQRVVLKNDQELQQVVQSSANNKVTLRCEF